VIIHVNSPVRDFSRKDRTASRPSVLFVLEKDGIAAGDGSGLLTKRFNPKAIGTMAGTDFSPQALYQGGH